jgi:hypothetical protein
MQTEKHVHRALQAADRIALSRPAPANRADRTTKKSCSRSGANARNSFVISTNVQKPRSKMVKNVLLFNNPLCGLPQAIFPAPKVVQTPLTRFLPIQILENRGRKRSKTFAPLTIAPLPELRRSLHSEELTARS